MEVANPPKNSCTNQPKDNRTMAAKPKDSRMNAKGGKKWTEGMKNLVLILTTCQLTIPTDDTDDMEVSEEPKATGVLGVDVAMGHNGNFVVDLQSLALWLWGLKRAQKMMQFTEPFIQSVNCR